MHPAVRVDLLAVCCCRRWPLLLALSSVPSFLQQPCVRARLNATLPRATLTRVRAHAHAHSLIFGGCFGRIWAEGLLRLDLIDGSEPGIVGMYALLGAGE